MRLALSVLLLGTVFAAPLAAQDQSRQTDSVPASARPPAGMCRIWLPNVPASKQAAPTDCATAVRNRPANARVIFGDALPSRGAARPGTNLPVAPLPLVPSDSPKKKKGAPPKIPPGEHSER